MLKPQREGEGHNVYRYAGLAFLDSHRAEDHEAWIAMEMIETPREVGIYDIDVVERELDWLVRTKGKESNESCRRWVLGAGQRGACMTQSEIANTKADENRTLAK